MEINIKINGLPIENQLILCKTLTTFIKDKTQVKDVVATINYYTSDIKSFKNNEELKIER